MNHRTAVRVLYATILVILATLLGSDAADVQYCHGGSRGICQGITFATPNTTCYAVNASIGPVDVVVGITQGAHYSVHTEVGCTPASSSLVFSNTGVNVLIGQFHGNIRSISAGTTPFPAVWTPLGCFTDLSSSSRALSAKVFTNSFLSPLTCQNTCAAFGFGFAGVEFGSECYCDYSIRSTSTPINASECNVPCGLFRNELCGGLSRINIFSARQALPINPPTVTDPNAISWSYNGCFTDDLGLRTLPLRIDPPTGDVNPQTCVNSCAAAGQAIAGVEFGTECWCGMAINANAIKVSDGECAQACVTNPSFFCGDANRLNIFKRAPV